MFIVSSSEFTIYTHITAADRYVNYAIHTHMSYINPLNVELFFAKLL